MNTDDFSTAANQADETADRRERPGCPLAAGTRVRYIHGLAVRHGYVHSGPHPGPAYLVQCGHERPVLVVAGDVRLNTYRGYRELLLLVAERVGHDAAESHGRSLMLRAYRQKLLRAARSDGAARRSV
jgi:hypothetical protein